MKVLATILLFLSMGSYGQECQYVTNKVSGMDGTRLVITKPLNLSKDFGAGSVDVWSTIYGDTSLVISFVFNVKENFPLKKGDSILVILDTDEIISLKVLQKPVIKTENKNKSLTALTIVNKQAIELFQSHPANRIKIYFDTSTIEGTSKKKKQALAIQTVINCVIEYLQ
ncbi:MAG: hypothetical protein JXB24_05910 [Bacteroidales bacterium]|nr:hypothetical protein [Bacteroidales bacterium]